MDPVYGNESLGYAELGPAKCSLSGWGLHWHDRAFGLQALWALGLVERSGFGAKLQAQTPETPGKPESWVETFQPSFDCSGFAVSRFRVY